MKTLVLIAASLFIATPVLAQDKMSAEDSRALSKLIEANMAEVAAGKLGEQKASGQQVKDFAKHMVDDHSKMLSELQQMAQSKGVKAPDQPDARHQAAAKKLESAKDFDQAFMDQMVKDHKEAISLVQKTAKDAKDPELKAAAQKAAPEMQQHLKMAQSIHAGKSASSGSSSSAGSSSSKDASTSNGGASARTFPSGK